MNPETIFKAKAKLDAELTPLYHALAALFEGGEARLNYRYTESCAHEANDGEALLFLHFTNWSANYTIEVYAPYHLLSAENEFDIDACVAYVKANAAICLHDADDAFPTTAYMDTVWPWENP